MFTGAGSRTHLVYNGGRDPRWGLGYAWEPAHLTIQEGDRVKFQWTSMPFVDETLFGVYETDGIGGEPTGTGEIDSGERTTTGMLHLSLFYKIYSSVYDLHIGIA